MGGGEAGGSRLPPDLQRSLLADGDIIGPGRLPPWTGTPGPVRACAGARTGRSCGWG
jgi:hypothetical protein